MSDKRHFFKADTHEPQRLDMVVASVLLSMGMMMLPPVMISLPFKLMLFVLVDGWNLIVGSLVKSFI